MMFTIGDIKNIAIQIEQNGEESYRAASQISKDPKITEILLWMAEEEKRHANWFANLQSSKPLTSEQKEIEAMGKALLQDMIRGNNFLLDQEGLNSAQTVQEVIDISRSFEEDTILFYEFLLGFMDDDETSAQLKTIIEEEKGHIRKLTEIFKTEKMNATVFPAD
jgi:rubrerythrin